MTAAQVVLGSSMPAVAQNEVSSAPELVSPEVHADKSVTLRFFSENARSLIF